ALGRHRAHDRLAEGTGDRRRADQHGRPGGADGGRQVEPAVGSARVRRLRGRTQVGRLEVVDGRAGAGGRAPPAGHPAPAGWPAGRAPPPPAVPGPKIPTRSSAIRRPAARTPAVAAASTTAAVPCMSSLNVHTEEAYVSSTLRALSAPKSSQCSSACGKSRLAVRT